MNFIDGEDRLVMVGTGIELLCWHEIRCTFHLVVFNDLHICTNIVRSHVVEVEVGPGGAFFTAI